MLVNGKAMMLSIVLKLGSSRVPSLMFCWSSVYFLTIFARMHQISQIADLKFNISIVPLPWYYCMNTFRPTNVC